MPREKSHLVIFMPLLVILSMTDRSWGSIGVSVEGVSDYSTYCGGSPDCNIDGAEQANGLQGTLRWPPSPLTSPWEGQFGDAYFDNDVWDRDFHDPDRTGNWFDNDTYLDRPEVSLSGIFLHGQCDDVRDPPYTACTTDANCPAGSYCPVFPPPQTGRARICIKNFRRTMVTSSTNSMHNNVVEYGENLTNVAFGESPNAGSWSGAGTNGGTNVILLMNSCGTRSKYAKVQLKNMFAGVHLLFMLMPTAAWKNTSTNIVGYSDTWTMSNRGSLFATDALNNLNAPARESWLLPPLLTNAFGVAQGDNRDTGGPPSGAHIVVSFDSTTVAARQRTASETWNESFDDTRDAHSNEAIAMTYMCNYDCYDMWGIPF